MTLPFSQPRIQTWVVKGAKGNTEPGRSGLEFDHVHPSTTAELIFAFAGCFLKLDCNQKARIFILLVAMTDQSECRQCSYRMKCNEDPSGAEWTGER